MPSPNSDEEIDLELEIRQRRKFTPEEAIGRLAGPGAMKGGSAVSRQKQAENAIGTWLSAHVFDPAGALKSVLHRHLKDSEALLNNLDRPLLALAECCERLLASEERLKELVREVDVQWGQAMDERPHFEKEGSAPDGDDPYTIRSVRDALADALEKLST